MNLSLTEYPGSPLQAARDTRRPSSQAVGVRAYAGDQPLLKQGFSAATGCFPLHSDQTTGCQLSPYTQPDQGSQARGILLKHAVAFRVGKDGYKSVRSQFEDHPLGLRQPGA